jgi:hypothetical protein
MSDAIKVALIRGVLTSVGAGALAFLLGLQQGNTLRVAAIAGGVQLCYNLLSRTGIEGYIDNQAAQPPKGA